MKKILIPFIVFIICIASISISKELGSIVITLFSVFGFGMFAYGFARINNEITIHIFKALVGFVLLGLSFGGAYFILGKQYFPKATSVFDYYYYSFITMTTFDYADIDNSSSVLIKSLVIIQCLLSLFYGILVLGTLFNRKEN